MSVTIRLADDIDVSRGDMICRPNNQPHVGQDIDAMICWLGERRPLQAGDKFAIKHTTQTARAMVKDLAVPARREHAAPRRGRPRALAQRDRAGHAAHHRSRCSSTSTAATARPAASS